MFILLGSVKLHQHSKGYMVTFPAFAGRGRPQVPLNVLFQVPAGKWKQPPTHCNLESFHVKVPKSQLGSESTAVRSKLFKVNNFNNSPMGIPIKKENNYIIYIITHLEVCYRSRYVIFCCNT